MVASPAGATEVIAFEAGAEAEAGVEAGVAETSLNNPFASTTPSFKKHTQPAAAADAGGGSFAMARGFEGSRGSTGLAEADADTEAAGGYLSVGPRVPGSGTPSRSRAVQFHPNGGQSGFVWLSARVPHVCPQHVHDEPDEIKRNTHPKNITALFCAQAAAAMTMGVIMISRATATGPTTRPGLAATCRARYDLAVRA